MLSHHQIFWRFRTSFKEYNTIGGLRYFVSCTQYPYLFAKNTVLSRNNSGISGGAAYTVGGFILADSSFTENKAVECGLAICSSSSGSSRVELQGVSFANNGRYCPGGQYQPYNYPVRSACENPWQLPVPSRCRSDVKVLVPVRHLDTTGRNYAR